MSAYSVLPPLDGMLRADRSEYFAGTTLNELSECQRRLPRPKSRGRSSRAKTLWSLSRLDTSAKVVGRRASVSGRRLVPMECSMSPRLRVKASASWLNRALEEAGDERPHQIRVVRLEARVVGMSEAVIGV